MYTCFLPLISQEGQRKTSFYEVNLFLIVLLPCQMVQLRLSGHCSLHVAKKKIPFLDNQGSTATPVENNGVKLELFIFDVFPFSSQMITLEVSLCSIWTL